MPSTMTLINTISVGAGGVSSIDFTSIPSTYTDLYLKLSLRSSTANDRRILFARFNGVTSGYADKSIRGYNNGIASQTDNGGNNSIAVWDAPAANATSSIFSNIDIYVYNYTSSNSKSVLGDGAGENNSATLAITGLTTGLSNITSAISSISLFFDSGTLVQYSTASLYGIKNS